MEEINAVFRVLDASSNRIAEGFRTLEEAARFSLDDAVLSRSLKSLRHDLSKAFSLLPRDALLGARDTAGDVGTDLETETEYVRPDIRSVVISASARLQQSLRVAEEYGKIIEPSFAKQVERLRYRTYQVCAELELRITSSKLSAAIQKAVLYLLIDGGKDEKDFEEKMKSLVASDIDVLQLRDSSLSDRSLLLRAKLGVQIAREAGKLFIVNDRADLAVAANADGVHVGQEELPATAARQIVGPHRLVGVSTHSLPQAQQAVADGADYIGCGPVFPSQTKHFNEFVGTDFLKTLVGVISLPCFAIGGINETNLSRVMETGFQRIAVAGAITGSEVPQQAAERLKKALLKSTG